MSWVVALLLACYAVVRGVLWIRGQVRWQLVGSVAPSPLAVRAAPGHLGEELRRLFDESERAAAQLRRCVHALERILVTDPDAALGEVRHGAFRCSTIDGCLAMARWLRLVEGLPGGVRDQIDGLGLTESPVRSSLEALASLRERVVRARPLEPFGVGEVRRTRAVLAGALQVVEGFSLALDAPSEHPYRRRAGQALPPSRGWLPST